MDTWIHVYAPFFDFTYFLLQKHVIGLKKERFTTQSYDKSPYNNLNIMKSKATA